MVVALVVDWRVGGVVALSVLMGVIEVAALVELQRMAGTPRLHRLWGVAAMVLLAAGPVVAGGRLALEVEWSVVVLAVFLLGLFLVDWLQGGLERGVGSLAVPALMVLYVWGCLGFLVRVAEVPGVGVAGVVLLLVVAKGSDVSAYYVGTRLGRHRLAPRVSPNKSLEGAAGALAVSLALALGLARPLGLALSPVQVVVFALVVSVAAQLGDLAESLLKRKLKAKDSAHLLPGFGGVLDMVDSLAGAAPVAFVLFRLMG